MNTQKVKEVLSAVRARMEKEKDFLTDLDNRIADGDHGINMARGFAAMEEKLAANTTDDLGAIFKSAGMTLVSAVGGSAGPLYGTAFLRTGAVMNGKTEMDIRDFLASLAAAVEGVKARGKAVRGEKTMLDAMIPALDAMTAAQNEGKSAAQILSLGVAAARDGVEYTKTIAATKGRASYIGERSIGHQDPGATSFTYILEVIADAVSGK